MAFGELNKKVAKIIAANSPKYSSIVEPFGDGGSFAFTLEKKRPKQHTVNFEDEMTFALMTFIQNITGSDKARLKAFDWVASEETFDKVLFIAATKGAELFYRYFYLKEFGVMAKDMEASPTFDWMRRGESMKSMLFDLPLMKIALKGVTLVLGDPMALVKSAGADALLILLPGTPEQTTAVEGKLSGISSPFFFAKKSKGLEELTQSLTVAGTGKIVVSAFTAASIMMADFETRTNYPNKLPLLEPEPGKASGMKKLM